MIDKDTVKRMENILHNLIDHVVSITQSDEDIDENIDSLISENVTALLKEAQAVSEAVAYRVKFKGSSEWELHKPDDGAFPVGDFESQELYTFPPTQEVEALKAKLGIATKALEFISKWDNGIMSKQMAFDVITTINNTNELQEPNTWRE